VHVSLVINGNEIITKSAEKLKNEISFKMDEPRDAHIVFSTYTPQMDFEGVKYFLEQEILDKLNFKSKEEKAEEKKVSFIEKKFDTSSSEEDEEEKEQKVNANNKSKDQFINDFILPQNSKDSSNLDMQVNKESPKNSNSKWEKPNLVNSDSDSDEEDIPSDVFFRNKNPASI
jgi:Tfp pilus assembly major pilin PilA